ncbi:MAG: hypothetical protein ABSF98_09115 [Bryobacteraceae bacterium]
MPKTEQVGGQRSIGLDIGTSRIVVARSAEKESQCEAQLNAFITLPWSKLTEQLLTGQNVFHEVHGDDIVVAGNDAEKFAEVFHVETRRPMLDGMLNPHEPHSLAVIRRIITRLLGKPAAGEIEKVFFSVPAPDPVHVGNLAYHERSCREILGDLGYQATAINEGLAVVFAELESSNYTGIGISCGSGMCNVCLAVLSVPVISFSIPKAGDFIDTHAATATGEVSHRIRVRKEHSFSLNGFSGDLVQNALNVYYEEVVHTLLDALCENLSAARRLPRLESPIPLVLSGGTVIPRGFFEFFKKVLSTCELPVRLSEVRVSAEPLNSTARGALMAASVS